MSQPEQPGWRWGPFTFRLPFYHTKLYWQEALQGLIIAAATGLAIVPLMTSFFGLTFEEAVAVSLVHSTLIASALIVFGEPYAPGWITPALPLVLAFVLGTYEDPTLRFQAMTALSLDFALLLFVLGVSGLGKKFVIWLPDTLKAGIILGAAIAALKRVFIDDAERFLLQQPIATALACGVCLIFAFSIPMQRLKEKYRFFAILGALGLLPGFLLAAIIGPMVGEVTYDIQWGILIPPVDAAWAKVSPFAIGWPSMEMFLQGMPLALITYIILFGDLVTGNEVIREGLAVRNDEHIDINPTRSHLSLAIRNALMGLSAPFFPTQGALWTGVHVIILQRWKQGKATMDSLHSGLHSYYLMGLPILFVLLPLLTGLRPLLGIALSLTLVLTGFACAYVAMAIPKSNTSRGAVLLIGTGLAFFEPWIGLLFALAVTVLLVGWDRNTDPIPEED
ncbi:MAG TPA: hypothetical protein ENI17_07340 [Pseudomonas xinjiangensis]|uniref:Permease family protein n=2 Tax=root TaxID=1 RepID=A0A7V1BM81_9GAMM|nr:hypothetical protein [Halopseudomonas xinjiangensis]HEC47427.1 hypothetical protein [Halopseudomonas xinjiangensis]